MKYFVVVEYRTREGKQATKFATVTAENKSLAERFAKQLTFGRGSVTMIDECG